MGVYFSPEHFPLLLRIVDREIDRLKKIYSRDKSDLISSRIESYIEIFNEIASASPSSCEDFSKIFEKYGSSNGLTADWYTIFKAEHLVH